MPTEIIEDTHLEDLGTGEVSVVPNLTTTRLIFFIKQGNDTFYFWRIV